MAEDIGRPLEAQGGAVLEVNASPGLQMHLQPSSGIPRPVGEAIVAHLFPAGQDGRIPLVGVLDGRGAEPTIRSVEPLLAAAFGAVGVVGGDGVCLEGRRTVLDAGRAATAIRSLLTNPLLAAGIFRVASRTSLRKDWALTAARWRLWLPPLPTRRRPNAPNSGRGSLGFFFARWIVPARSSATRTVLWRPASVAVLPVA